MKIGLVMIATGKYIRFIDPLIESACQYFLPNHSVTYHVFTDNQDYLKRKESNLIPLYRKHEAWPNPTLLRYETFVNYYDQLIKMDYLFYCDADMLFCAPIGDEILSQRVATIHPGFLGGRGTPETRWQSTAYISPVEKLVYYAGGFNGGTAKDFLEMSKKIDKNIKKDLEYNIIAKWHDESHLNKYLMDNPPTKVLSPSYCYPENWKLNYEKKLLALDKNHSEIRT